MRSNNRIVACTCIALLLHCSPALGWSLAKPKGASITTTKSVEKQPDPQRRAIFSAPIILALSSTLFITDPAHAFDNGVPEYANYVDKPKRRGTPPKDLGVLPRTTEGEDDQLTLPALRTCDGNPNCFSTTGDFLLSDRTQYGVDFLVGPWLPPSSASNSDLEAFQTLKKVVKSYEAGQGGIDGGGFAVIKETDSYLYCQFESLKKGYIDDVEFAVAKGTNGIQVRSASRVGYTDFGVNAIRLNYFASQLREKGWKIDEITESSHRDYWTASDEAREATFDASRRDIG